MIDVIGVVFTALIGAATSRAVDASIDKTAGRFLKPRAIEYVPRSFELDAIPLTNAAQQRSQDLIVDQRWQLGNDNFRRAGQPGISKRVRRDLLLHASYDYNWTRRNEDPGSLPQVHSALMYALTTSLLGEDDEALRAVRDSLSGQFNNYGIFFTGLEVSRQGKKYDTTNARLKIAMAWVPSLGTGGLAPVSEYRTARLNGPALQIGLTGSREFLAQEINPYGPPLLTFSGVNQLNNFSRGTWTPAGNLMTGQYGTPWTASTSSRLRPRNAYQQFAADALQHIRPFSAIEASESAAADAWIEASLPRLIPVYMFSSEDEPSPDQIITKLKVFSFRKVLIMTEGMRFSKELQHLDGKLVLGLHWRPGDGAAPIVAAVQKLIVASL